MLSVEQSGSDGLVEFGYLCFDLCADASLYVDDEVSDAMRAMMDDLGMNMNMLKNSSMFSGDEEAFAFARALSRLSEMGSQEWVERGMGLEGRGGKKEAEDWQKVRSHYHQDSYG